MRNKYSLVLAGLALIVGACGATSPANEPTALPTAGPTATAAPTSTIGPTARPTKVSGLAFYDSVATQVGDWLRTPSLDSECSEECHTYFHTSGVSVQAYENGLVFNAHAASPDAGQQVIALTAFARVAGIPNAALQKETDLLSQAAASTAGQASGAVSSLSGVWLVSVTVDHSTADVTTSFLKQ